MEKNFTNAPRHFFFLNGRATFLFSICCLLHFTIIGIDCALHFTIIGIDCALRMTSRGPKKVLREDLPINVASCNSLSIQGNLQSSVPQANNRDNQFLPRCLSSLHSELDQLLLAQCSP